MATAMEKTGLAPWTDLVVSGLLAAGTLTLLVATLNDFGMTWDEGFTVEREERLREWFARVASPGSPVPLAWPPTLSKLEPRWLYLQRAGPAADSLWSRESLRFYWQFARAEPSGHPPFYALLGLAGWAASHRLLPPPASYRFGPAVLFAVAVGVVYHVLARHYGRIAAAAAALALVTMPRLFAHAHLASYDVPTLCLWFLAAAAFLRAAEPPADGRDRAWLWTIALGAAWGCALATKFTGWFLPIPLAVWAALYRNRRAARALMLGGVIAAVGLYALIPTWWTDPVRGVRVFLVSNLTRDQLKPIPTLFLGRLYRFSLPWYNTLVWTAIVVPPATLLLALVGMSRVVAGRLRDRAGTLFFLCWAFFMVLRALPTAPGHDGERLFLPAFVFLACLAGIGVAALGTGFVRIAGSRLGPILTTVLLAVAAGAGSWSTWRYHPLQLSYYNAFIGGLSGAYRAGMEPTYYWDAVTPDVRDWLNAHTEAGRSVTFNFPAVTFEYLHHWGLLRPYPLRGNGPPPRWFVVMNRPGHLLYFPGSIGRFLLERVPPAYVKTLGVAPDVPLVAVFTGEDTFAADLILKRQTSGPDRGPAGDPAAPRSGPNTPRPARGDGAGR
jgi:4-amino-4-deoxy-L-arabinose transferase-like glycosyltransferase